MTYIGSYAFQGCKSLTSIVIPKLVTTLKSYTFEDCSKLTSVIIPNSVIKIKTYTFSKCGLTSITIPNSVTSIGDYAFYYCRELQSVNIPKSVKSIGDYAFAAINEECIITCYATTPPTLGRMAFFNTTVVVPCLYIDVYKNSDWRNITKADFLFDFITKPNNKAWGSVKIVQQPDCSSDACTQAIASEHYHFVKWSDGNIDNPRTIKVTSDTTLTAVFAIDTFKVTASAENGTVSGDGEYAYGTKITLTASPAEHYHFVKWSDGNIDNLRTIKVTSNTTLTAVFAIDTHKVTTSAENGTVSGAGEYAYGTETPLTAMPAEHYHFVKWSDGNIDNPRTIKVTSDTTLTAVFAIDTFKVTASAENGNVSGDGEYAYGTKITLTASPAEHYHFVKWSDDSISNSRSITVTTDTTFTPIFAIDTHKVTASAENGTVSGAGEYAYGEKITLTASPAEHYHFVKWSDEVKTTQRTVIVACDSTFNAIFEAHNVVTDDSVAPTCTATGLTEGKHCSVCNAVLAKQDTVKALGHTVVIDDSVAPTCTAIGLTEGKHCSVCNAVLAKQDTVKALGHTVVIDDSVAPTCTATGLTEGKHCSVCNAVLAKQDTVKALGHTVVIDDSVAPTCTATGLTEGKHCSVCDNVLVAQQTIPMLEHSFTNYIYNNDATTEADGTETATCDNGCGTNNTRTATGTKLTDIAGETANVLNIYAHHNVIVVENADADIYVYDATGRLIDRRDVARNVSITLQREGIYIVRTGGYSQRVVVSQN